MAASSHRQYSQDEIQDIFRRAAERQESSLDDAAGEGLTLDELRQIGAESGLDPAHIEAAARELAADATQPSVRSEDPTGIERVYGMAASAHMERVVPGTVDDETWREMVHVMESVFQNAGETTKAGALREWHLSSSLGFDKRIFQSSSPSDWVKIFDSAPTHGPVTVELHPEEGDTRVSMDYEMPTHRLWEAPGLAGFFLTLSLFLAGLFVFVGEPIILLPATLMLVFGSVLGLYFRSSHRKEIKQTRERMAKALDRLTHIQEGKQQRTGQNSRASAQREPGDPPDAEASGARASEPLLDDSDERASDANASPSGSPRRRTRS